MAVKFLPSLFRDVDKGLIRAVFRGDAVEAAACGANALDAFPFCSYGLLKIKAPPAAE
jgi:hypothetical protein